MSTHKKGRRMRAILARRNNKKNFRDYIFSQYLIYLERVGKGLG